MTCFPDYPDYSDYQEYNEAAVKYEDEEERKYEPESNSRRNGNRGHDEAKRSHDDEEDVEEGEEF